MIAYLLCARAIVSLHVFCVHQSYMYYWRIIRLCSAVAVSHVFLYCVHLTFTCVCLWSHFYCSPMMVAQFYVHESHIYYWRINRLCSAVAIGCVCFAFYYHLHSLFIAAFLACTCGCTFVECMRHLLLTHRSPLLSGRYWLGVLVLRT